jgi:hypothetical protein
VPEQMRANENAHELDRGHLAEIIITLTYGAD